MASEKTIGLLHRAPVPVKAVVAPPSPVEPPVSLGQQIAQEQQCGGAIRRFARPGKTDAGVLDDRGRYRLDGDAARRLVDTYDRRGKF
jgi:hypothetical protein